MRISLRPRRRLAMAIGLGALALAGGVPALAAARPAAPRGDVLVDCAGQAQVRPHGFMLACADSTDYLTRVDWVSWGGGAAFGRGTEHVDDCVPNCGQGHFHAFPVLITAWRAVPRPGHAGQLYLSRLTEIYTGKRPAHVPQTVTWHLTR